MTRADVAFQDGERLLMLLEGFVVVALLEIERADVVGKLGFEISALVEKLDERACQASEKASLRKVGLLVAGDSYQAYERVGGDPFVTPCFGSPGGSL